MAPYTLMYNAARNVVEAEFHGHWSVAEAQTWRKDVDRLLGGIKPGFTMIVDMTDHPTQSQEVKAVHDASMKETVGHGVSKVVAIVSSSVLAMQMKRSAAGSGGAQLFEFVTSKEDALKALAA